MHKESLIRKFNCNTFEIPISYLCVFIITLFSIINGKLLGGDNNDGASYIIFGLQLFQEIPNNYPSYLYQIMAAVVSGGYFGATPQIINLAYLSCIVFFFTNILLFDICRKKTSTITALIFIIILCDWHVVEIYPEAAVRALTDPYGMFFLVLSSFFMIKGKYKLSGVAMAVSVLFRTQCLLFVLLVPILSKEYRRSCLPFLILFGIVYTLISSSLPFFLGLEATNSSYTFYSSMVAGVAKFSQMIPAAESFWDGFTSHISSRFILPFLVVIFIFICFVKENREFLIFSFLITLLTLLCNGWLMRVITFPAASPVIVLRYFMYCLPYLLMSSVIIVYYFIKKETFAKYTSVLRHFTACKIFLLLCIIYAFTLPSADTALKVFTHNRVNETDLIPLQSIESPLSVSSRRGDHFRFLNLFLTHETAFSKVTFDPTSIRECPENTELPRTLLYLQRFAVPKSNNSSEFIDFLKNNEEITYCNTTYIKAGQVDSKNLEYYIFKRATENK